MDAGLECQPFLRGIHHEATYRFSKGKPAHRAFKRTGLLHCHHAGFVPSDKNKGLQRIITGGIIIATTTMQLYTKPRFFNLDF